MSKCSSCLSSFVSLQLEMSSLFSLSSPLFLLSSPANFWLCFLFFLLDFFRDRVSPSCLPPPLACWCFLFILWFSCPVIIRFVWSKPALPLPTQYGNKSFSSLFYCDLYVFHVALRMFNLIKVECFSTTTVTSCQTSSSSSTVH